MKHNVYACFVGIKYFPYYFRGQSCVLEVDRVNIFWIEKSEIPIIDLRRLFMQSVVVHIKHIAGLKNKVADWL